MQIIFTENRQIQRIINMDNIIQVAVARHVTVKHGIWFCCGMSSDGTACGFTLPFKDEATVNYILDQIRMGTSMGWTDIFVPIDNIPKEGD